MMSRVKQQMISSLILFPNRPIDFVINRKGYDFCPECGETRVTDCIHDKLTFLCGSSGTWNKIDTKCERERWIPFVEMDKEDKN